MNCPTCKNDQLSSFIKSDFKKVFESYYSLSLEQQPEYTIPIKYLDQVNSLAKFINHLTFAYRYESITDIAEQTGLCSCIVLDAISALESNPIECLTNIRLIPDYLVIPIIKLPIQYLGLTERLNQLVTNSLFESYDFESCITVKELLVATNIKNHILVGILRNHFGFNLDYLCEEKFESLLSSMMASDERRTYEEQRFHFYTFDEISQVESFF